MKRVFSQKRIVFLFLKPVRRARTFLVPRRHVTRDRFSESLGLGALEGNNFLRHSNLFLRFRRWRRFFFLALAALILGQTKQRRDRLANAGGFVLLLEL